LKDPRFSMLIDFWLPYLRGRNVSFIHVVRHPTDVANSLERRDGFPKERGLLLWFLQNLNAEYFTRGLNRCFINYEDYIRDWRGSLEKAFQQLEISPVRGFDQAKDDIDEFITKGRSRQEGTGSGPQGIGCKLVEEAFETLRDAGPSRCKAMEDRCDELRNRFCDSAGLLFRTLNESAIRAELEAARKRISLLTSKELVIKGRVDELEKRKLLLTERDAFRAREFLSTSIWRFWWLWLPFALIPIWIFD
jgi:hypothetical protein